MANETLPKVIADYIKTVSGQIMLDGSAWFRWDIAQRKIIVSSNSPSPKKNPVEGTMFFVRGEDGGWRRHD